MNYNSNYFGRCIEFIECGFYGNVSLKFYAAVYKDNR